MAGHGQFQRAADYVAGHGGRDGLGRILDLLKNLLKYPRRAGGLFAAADFLEDGQIGPRAEVRERRR